MNGTGYYREKVIMVIRKLNETYTLIHGAIDSNIQTGFIGGMSEIWASKEAQEFFKNVVAPQFNEIIRTVNTNFSSINNSMNSVARVWEMMSQLSNVWTNIDFPVIVKEINVSSIKEVMSDGFRGIKNKERFFEITGKLNKFQTEVEGYLDSAISTLDSVRDVFVGGDQFTSLRSALLKNKTIIIEYMLIVNEALKKSIDTTLNNYNQLADKVSSAFVATEE